uniref:Uncharacterized protein n=1 Tax=Lactuca sativa TaxID=4236 RepID=A0A9R1V0K2_LACSA|nr:hypothetical protein LSAT_V11C700367390 [Lactuca sativa]
MEKQGRGRPAAPAGSGSGSSSRSRSRFPPPQSKRASPPPSFVTREAMMQYLEDERILREEAIQTVYDRLDSLEIEMTTLEAWITKLELGDQVANQRP